MSSFAAYPKLKTESLKRIAQESIDGIKEWFVQHPSKKICKAELWYGIWLHLTQENVEKNIKQLLEDTLKSDAEDNEKWAKIPKQTFSWI